MDKIKNRMEKKKITDLQFDDKNFRVLHFYGDGNYFINEDGDIISIKGKSIRYLKTYINNSGYTHYVITHNGKCKTILKHRALALVFIKGRTKIKCVVNHIDGNKLNNEISNLEWVSILENSKHARKNGLTVGVPHSEDTKRLISKKHKERGGWNYTAKKVKDIETGSIYNSAKEVVGMTKYSYTYFNQMLNGIYKNKTSFVWA